MSILKNVLSLATAAFVLTPPAEAAVITIEALLQDVSGSTALLDEFGISEGGSLIARFRFDNDLSGNQPFMRYETNSAVLVYLEFSIIGPGRTVTTPTANSENAAIEISDRDSLQIAQPDSFALHSTEGQFTDPLFRQYSLSASNDPLDPPWDRQTPITAAVLNSFSSMSFAYSERLASLGGSLGSMSTSSISFTQVAAVPLPASLPLALGGVFALGAIGLRRRKPLSPA